MRGRTRSLALAAAALAAVLTRCASVPPPDQPSAAFPRHARLELEGTFDDAVSRGWRALAAGDPRTAANAFAEPTQGASARAAAIGSVEALVLLGRADEAVERCGAMLDPGDPKPNPNPNPTTPLLTACGEAYAHA